MYKNVAAVFGVPRSGTSWMGQIIDSCPEIIFKFQPLFSYRFKNRINTESTSDDIEKFFKELYCENSDKFLNQTDKKEKGMYPIFKEKVSNPSTLAFKEGNYLHTIPILLQRCRNVKIVCLVRNPFDVLESWINAPSEFKTEWSLMEEWRFASKKNQYKPENYFGYHKWKECIKLNLDMQREYSQNFMTIRYEDLEDDTLGICEKVFYFLGLPFTIQSEEFIIDSQSRTVEGAYSVYRKKGEERKRCFYLPSEVKEEISYDLERFDEARAFGY